MGNVVDDAKGRVVAKYLLKGVAGKVGDDLAIGTGKVGRSGHGRKMVLALGRLRRDAGESAAWQGDCIAARRSSPSENRCSRLMAEAARARCIAEMGLVIERKVVLDFRCAQQHVLARVFENLSHQFPAARI